MQNFAVVRWAARVHFYILWDVTDIKTAFIPLISAQVDLGGGAYTTSGGGMPGTYNAAQFHFHWGSNSNQGSEHKVAGAAFPLEVGNTGK